MVILLLYNSVNCLVFDCIEQLELFQFVTQHGLVTSEKAVTSSCALGY